MIHHEQQAIAKIHSVLRNFRKKPDCIDVPMIAKYRKQDYKTELTEEDIWTISRLDQEYGKFQQQMNQIRDFLIKVAQFEPSIQQYIIDISQVKDLQYLQHFSPLISFLKSYYNEELSLLPNQQQKRKLPQKSDHVQAYRKNKIDEIVRQLFLKPAELIDNLIEMAQFHKPPALQISTKEFLRKYASGEADQTEALLAQAIKYAALELSVQPRLRARAKEHMSNIGTVTTEPSEQGKKDLDPFHPSFRVKRIKQMRIADF